MSTKRNIILIDFDASPKWEMDAVLSEITEEDWDIAKCVTNKYHKNKFDSLKRIFLYFFFPLTIVIKRKKYDKIIGWQQFFGLNIAFWCRLFRLKKRNDITIMTFIYKKKNGIIGTIYHKYMSYILSSKYIDRIICYSKNECKYYSQLFNIKEQKFIFTHLGIAPISCNDTSNHGYIFAPGRSNRDFDFLSDVIGDTPYKCIIACDSLKNKVYPPNITILNNCTDENMINVMAHSRCVAIPLKDLMISSGQLVALQAMALGKIIICTCANGITDYVDNEYAFVLQNDINTWKQTLNCIFNDDDIVKTKANLALQHFNNQFTENTLFRNIATILNCQKADK